MWDYALFRVSEDHLSIERIPYRASSIHVNVTRFVEPPECAQCLTIGKPDIQADGSIKVKVTLRHPFPDQPEFTGFDVRGTVMFPATHYWYGHINDVAWFNRDEGSLFGYDHIPHFFSRASHGGGELLNADGFTLYFFPGFEIPGFDKPIFKYWKGIHANGPNPDSTINGYKLFTDDTDRRMFLVTDTISRTYHISPPEGEFIFGYVVDASWTWPSVMPVTDPKTQFPPWANAEDGVILDVVQNYPFKTGTYGWSDYNRRPPPWDERMVVTITSQVYYWGHMPKPDNVDGYIFCPDLTEDEYVQLRGVATGGATEFGLENAGILTHYAWIREGTYEADPGNYVALVAVKIGNYTNSINKWPITIKHPVIFQFMELEVIAGD